MKDRNGVWTYKYIGQKGHYIGVIQHKGKYYAPLDGTTNISYLYEIINDECSRDHEKLEISYQKLQRLKGYDEVAELK